MKQEKKSKKEIKVIIFDIGGVLLQSSYHKVIKRLAKIYNLDAEKLFKIIIKYSKQIQTGKISLKKYYQSISKELNLKNPKELAFIWNFLIGKKFKINSGVEKIIKNLRKKYLVGTLTNVSKNHEIVRVKKKAYRHFKIKLTSLDHGLMKPDIRFYELLIKKLKVCPEKIIFIDNHEENLIPAKKLSIKTILFKNNRQLIKDLKKFGVKILKKI